MENEYIYKIVKDKDGVDCYIKTGQIVRCKYCKHYDFSEVNITPYSAWYRCKATGMYTPQTHYCGFGERREDDRKA